MTFISKKHLIFVGLLLILGFALFARLWRLDYGMELPYLAHTDEPTQYNPAIRILATGDLNPRFFNYPSLSIYLHVIVLGLGFVVGLFTGRYESLADLDLIHTLEMSVGITETPELLLLGRATTAVVGALTVGVLFVLARQLTKRAWLPLWVASLLAISGAHIQLSHYMTVDVIATAFAVACVTLCTLALAHPDRRRYVWLAALCGGLATSSKYNYAVLSVPVGMAVVLAPVVQKSPACWSARWRVFVQSLWPQGLRRLALSGALFCLAFVLASPFVLLDFDKAWEAIAREMRHYATGHLGVTGSSFLWYAEYLWGVNVFYLLLGIPGLALALWRKKLRAAPFVVFVLLYYALIGKQTVHFDRNVLPVLVLLLAGMGVTLDALLDVLVQKVVVAIPQKTVGVLLLLLPLLPSLWALPPFLEPPHPSGKALAQAWFAEVFETSVGQRYLYKRSPFALNIVAEPYTVYLDPEFYHVTYITNFVQPEFALPYLRAKHYDVAILGSGMFHRFYASPDIYASEIAIYDALLKDLPCFAFEGRYDPLEFRKNGTDVYVCLLSDAAEDFHAALELDFRDVNTAAKRKLPPTRTLTRYSD